MEHIIVLKKEDIRTNQLGSKYILSIKGRAFIGNLKIIFDDDAIDEFINDIKVIREEKNV